MSNTSKKIKIAIIIILGIFIAVFFLYRSVIFQEGNPWPLMKAITKLNISSDGVVILDSESEKYLTKSKDGPELIIKKMSDNGYNFIEQMGSAYIFSSDSDKIIATQKQYSRFYSLWNITREPNYVEEEKSDQPKQTDSLKANYISFQNYKLSIFRIEEYKGTEFSVENGEINCNATDQTSSLPLRISKKEINGQKYCIGAFSEGAAGSVYTEYAYATVIRDHVYLVLFTARYPHCSNYPDQERTECETERESFDLDNIIDQEINKNL